VFHRTNRLTTPAAPIPPPLAAVSVLRSLAAAIYRHYFVVSSFGLLQGGTITVRIGKVRVKCF